MSVVSKAQAEPLPDSVVRLDRKSDRYDARFLWSAPLSSRSNRSDLTTESDSKSAYVRLPSTIRLSRATRQELVSILCTLSSDSTTEFVSGSKPLKFTYCNEMGIIK